MGGAPGDPRFSVMGRPHGAWSPEAESSLVVWAASDTVEGLLEIYAQRVATDGTLLGSRIQVSDLSQGNPSFESHGPAIAYNSLRDEYLVVWSGREFFAPLLGREIYGRRIASNGTILGDTTRLSFMGSDDANDESSAFNPAVTYNAVDDQFVVVWYADAGAPGLANNEYEIFARRLDGTGGPLGEQVRVSSMGIDGDPDYDAFEPDVGFDPVTRRFLVVWHGDENHLSDDGWEVWGQLFDAELEPLGIDDFVVSNTGGVGDPTYTASWPSVAFNPPFGEWLVAWHGDSDQGLLVDEEFEIFGQRLNSGGGALGVDDFRISKMGPDGSTDHFALEPHLAVGADGTGLVAWHGLDRGLKTEIHVRRIALGGVLPEDSWQITETGPAGDPSYGAFNSGLLVTELEFLALFVANDDTGGHDIAEFDVFGQRLAFKIFCDGFESGDGSEWSLVSP